MCSRVKLDDSNDETDFDVPNEIPFPKFLLPSFEGWFCPETQRAFGRTKSTEKINSLTWYFGSFYGNKMHGLGIYMKKEYRHKTKPNQEMQIGEWQYGVPTMSFLRNERNSIKRDKNIKK